MRTLLHRQHLPYLPASLAGCACGSLLLVFRTDLVTVATFVNLSSTGWSDPVALCPELSHWLCPPFASPTVRTYTIGKRRLRHG